MLFNNLSSLLGKNMTFLFLKIKIKISSKNIKNTKKLQKLKTNIKKLDFY